MDETSIQLGLVPDYSRCELGKRCVSKSNNNNVFKKYTLLSAISSTGIVGYKLYEQGGMTTQRFIEFLDEFIVDNAGAHRNEDVRRTINESRNELLYAIPYTPKTNAIENWFSQLKHYLKKDGVLTYRDLQRSVRSAIKRIRPEHYLNYFRFAYRKAELRTYDKKLSTKRRSPKLYK